MKEQDLSPTQRDRPASISYEPQKESLDVEEAEEKDEEEEAKDIKVEDASSNEDEDRVGMQHW